MPAVRVGSEAIIAKTLALFRLKGYHSTSMDDVAVACNIRKASLYHHFASKEALALAALERVREIFEKEVFSHAYEEALPPLVRMERLTKATEDYFFSGDGGCLVGNFALETIDQNPAFQQAIQGYFDAWAKAVGHLLATAMPADRADLVAADLVAEIQGAIMMMRVYRQPDFLRRVSAKMLAFLHASTDEAGG